MEIRPDFKDVEPLLQRLSQFASVFDKNEFDGWSHLKNKEDFDHVYSLEQNLRFPLEEIYCKGRDLAGHMSSRLIDFNYPELYPTLKKFVDSFDNGWLSQIDELTNDSQIAKEIYDQLDYKPWSVGEMIKLYDKQVSLLQDVKRTLDALKRSTIYKFDSDSIQFTNQSEAVAEPKSFADLESSCLNRLAQMFERGTTHTTVHELFDGLDIGNDQRHPVCELLKTRRVIKPTYQLGQKLPYVIEILPGAIEQRDRRSASSRNSSSEPVPQDICGTVYGIALLWFGEPNARFAKFFAIAGVTLIAAPWWQPVLQQLAVVYLNVPATFLADADGKLFWSGWVFIAIALSLYIWVKRLQSQVEDTVA